MAIGTIATEGIGVIGDAIGFIGGLFGGGNVKERQRQRDIARNFLKSQGLTIRIEADNENYESMVWLADLARNHPEVVTSTLNNMYPAGVKLQSPGSSQFRQIVMAIESAIDRSQSAPQSGPYTDPLQAGYVPANNSGPGAGVPVIGGWTMPQITIAAIMAGGVLLAIKSGR